MYPTELGFEFTHGDRIGAAVPRLKHSATLAFFDKNQNNAVYSALVFFLELPDISNILNELECTHLCELIIRSFFRTGCYLDTESVAQNEVFVIQRV